MKFFLLVLSSQALLCARVFSQLTANNGGQQSEPDKQEVSSLKKCIKKIISVVLTSHAKTIRVDCPVIKQRDAHKAEETVDNEGFEIVVMAPPVVVEIKSLLHE